MPQKPDVQVRFGTEKDAQAYHKLAAEVIKHNYLLESAGLHKDDFDEAKFFSEGMHDYFKKLLDNTDHQKTLVAELDGKIVGGITINKHKDNFELLGLSVAPSHQGKGISLRLLVEVNKLVGKNHVIAKEFANAWGGVNAYFANKFVIDPNSSPKAVHPDWLKHKKSLLEYTLVRPLPASSTE